MSDSSVKSRKSRDYFADGMVEEIITALSRYPSLFVIARGSSFAYKLKSVDVRQVGRQLGVRYILEGSLPSPIANWLLCHLVHGHQQLALFNAHYDERCFLPIHVYDTATSCVVG